MTPQHQLELEILEHIYENDQGWAREPADLGPIHQRFGEEESHSACRALRDRGLIEIDGRLAGGYHVQSEGRAVVEAMRARRSDRGYRRGQCREQLLAWLDAHSDFAAGVRPAVSDFDGWSDLRQFDSSEVSAAVTHLKTRGLIDTLDGWGGAAAMWITEAGREAVDAGGVRTSEEARQAPQSVTNTFNMGGSSNNFATAAAPGATASVHVSNFNLNYAKNFAAAIRSVESDLDLTDDDRDDLVQIELSEPGTDLSLAQRATARLYDRVDKIATGAAGGLLATLARQAIGMG